MGVLKLCKENTAYQAADEIIEQMKVGRAAARGKVYLTKEEQGQEEEHGCEKLPGNCPEHPHTDHCSVHRKGEKSLV